MTPITNIAIIFVGGGDCYRVLRREPMLSSRVYVWQEFRRLSPQQVLAVIPAYHPIWAAADPADIGYADKHAGHGNFRAWAKITAHAVTARCPVWTGRPALRRTGSCCAGSSADSPAAHLDAASHTFGLQGRFRRTVSGVAGLRRSAAFLYGSASSCGGNL